MINQYDYISYWFTSKKMIIEGEDDETCYRVCDALSMLSSVFWSICNYDDISHDVLAHILWRYENAIRLNAADTISIRKFIRIIYSIAFDVDRLRRQSNGCQIGSIIDGMLELCHIVEKQYDDGNTCRLYASPTEPSV